MKVARVAIASAFALAACTAVVPGVGGPADTVRAAFERIAAHDLAGGSTLVCPEQRDPNALPIIVGGIFGPTGPVPAGLSTAETLALYELDISGIRVEDVRADDGVVQVPVSGVLRERLDPDEVDAAIRRTSAAQNEAVDEPALRAVLAEIRAGPFELDLDQNVEAVQVMKVGSAWLICEPLPSPAPSPAAEAPATSTARGMARA